MHYRVKSSVPVLANATKNGEDSDNRPSAAWQLGEIALSHEVMEGKITWGWFPSFCVLTHFSYVYATFL